jgi:hypothetical protein
VQGFSGAWVGGEAALLLHFAACPLPKHFLHSPTDRQRQDPVLPLYSGVSCYLSQCVCLPLHRAASLPSYPPTVLSSLSAPSLLPPAPQIDNEDLLFSLETLVERFAEHMAPYAVGLTTHLAAQFWRIAADEDEAAAAAGSGSDADDDDAEGARAGRGRWAVGGVVPDPAPCVCMCLRLLVPARVHAPHVHAPTAACACACACSTCACRGVS